MYALLAVTISAQNETGLTSKGIHIGMNLSYLTDYGNTEARVLKPGFCGGLYLTYNLTEKFAIQPEILYFMKGSKNDFDDDSEGMDTKWNLSYLEIPILFKITQPLNEKTNVNFLAGPTVSFLLSAKIESDWDEIDGYDLKDDLEATDFGITLGMGIDHTFSSMVVSFDARFTLGLMDILTGPKDGYGIFTNRQSTNNNIYFLLGLGF